MSRDLRDACSWDFLYSPHTHHLINQFYEPVLQETVIYDRVAGYFRSSVLSAVSIGYENFCDYPTSKMRLIVGLEMTQEDHDRIMFWDDPRRVEEEMLKEVEIELSREDMPDFEKSRLAGLSWMLENDKLEIKFGVMLDQETKEPMPWEWAKMHHKICLFTDDVKPKPNSALIMGSVNESAAAWGRNGDSFTPQVSWEEGRSADTVTEASFLFKQLWSCQGFDKNLNIGVFRLSELKETWKRIVPPIHPKNTQGSPGNDEEIEFEDDEESDDNNAWIHQKTAVELFLADKNPDIKSAPKPAGGQGILCMATGTGKTRTALKIVKRMIEEEKINKVIITTLKTDILDQWDEEMKDPGRGLLSLIKAKYKHYDGKTGMYKFLDSESTTKSILMGRENFVKLIQESSREDLKDTLLIVDECHNFRGEGHMDNMAGLYHQIPYRLGLSATPDSEYDKNSTQFLFDEIGDIYFEFGLQEAIENGILCSFEYHCYDYTPSANDRNKVKSIIAKYNMLIKENPTRMTSLDREKFRKISDVYKQSKQKIPLIKEALSTEKDILKRTIIFGPTKKWNEEIINILSEEDARFITYYGETDKSNLKTYEKGDIEVLLTCDAIKEGVDLNVNDIILISSNRAKLENIQRIGRALRTHGNPDKIARVYDFIGEGVGADKYRQEWLDELSKIKYIEGEK